jgi:hypothetical protein
LCLRLFARDGSTPADYTSGKFGFFFRNECREPLIFVRMQPHPLMKVAPVLSVPIRDLTWCMCACMCACLCFGRAWDHASAPNKDAAAALPPRSRGVRTWPAQPASLSQPASEYIIQRGRQRDTMAHRFYPVGAIIKYWT